MKRTRPLMPLPITIRPYQTLDHDTICALWNTLFPRPSLHNEPSSIIRAKLAMQAEWLIVAEWHNTVVGSIIAGYDGHRGWLNLVAVAPEQQGQGIGKKLVEHAIDQLKQSGCKKVNIQVRQGNQAVVAFYQRLGFDIEERISLSRFI